MVYGSGNQKEKKERKRERKLSESIVRIIADNCCSATMSVYAYLPKSLPDKVILIFSLSLFFFLVCAFFHLLPLSLGLIFTHCMCATDPLSLSQLSMNLLHKSTDPGGGNRLFALGRCSVAHRQDACELGQINNNNKKEHKCNVAKKRVCIRWTMGISKEVRERTTNLNGLPLFFASEGGGRRPKDILFLKGQLERICRPFGHERAYRQPPMYRMSLNIQLYARRKKNKG